jgi:hypothetical protein
MSRIIKVNAEQSAPYSSTNNIVDFMIEPAQYDMTRSFVNLQIETTQAFPDVAGARANVANAIAPYFFKHHAVNNIAFNATLVKHCRLEADGKKLEDLQRNDIRIQEQLTYAKNLDDIKGDEYMSLIRGKDIAGRRSALGLEQKSLGESMSVAGLVNVMIPVSHLFNLGKYKLCPLDKLENIKMHLELNPGLIACEGAITQEYTTNAGLVNNVNLQFGDASYRTFDDITAGAADVDATSITTTHKFKNLTDSPYFVGMPLHISSKNDTAAVAQKYAYITKIVQNANGTLTLSLSHTLGTVAAGKSMTVIQAFGVNVDMSFEIVGAELSLVQVPTQPVDSFEYTTYEHEQDFGSDLTDFQRQYYLPAGCMNVMVCHPAHDLFCLQHFDVGGSDSILSSYRLRTEQEDLTDRNVVYKSPLYHDVASAVLARSGIPMKNALNLLPTTSEVQNQHAVGSNAKNTIFIGGSVPMSNERKNLDVALKFEAGAGCQNVHIYKEVAKKL